MLFVRYRATEDYVEQFLICCPLAKQHRKQLQPLRTLFVPMVLRS